MPGTVGFRLSPQQEQLLTSADGGSVAQCAALLAGPLHEGRLRSALEQVIARHEILRTTFAQPAGMRVLQQMIHEQLLPTWSVERASASVLARDRMALSDVLAREAERGAAPALGPVVRALLIAEAQADGLLVLTLAGGCSDANSLLLMLDQLAEVYQGSSELPEPVQYADYAQWRHELITDEAPEADAGRSFWREDAVDRSAPAALLFGTYGQRAFAAHASLGVDLPGAELGALREAAEAAGVSVPVLLEAAWHGLLARLSGANHLLVAGWFDGRSEADLAQAIGSYAQPGPIRSRFEDGTSFAEVLDQVRRARASVSRLQDYAAAPDLSAVAHDAAAGFSALAVPVLRQPVTEIVALRPPAEPVALMLRVRLSDTRLEAEIHFDPAAFDRGDAAELAQRLRAVVASAIADPAQPVLRLAITDPAERAQIVAGAAGMAPEPDAATPLHHLFEQQVQRTPDRVAVSSRALNLTYAELNQEANRLAHHLRELGVAPNLPVGLCMERSPSMLAAVLGILKAGGAYLPLNFEHPVARLGHQLTQAGASVVVTEEHLLERLSSLPGRTVCLDRDADTLATHPVSNPGQLAGPDDLVYVMYTSGSTGTPKGVAVTHGNLSNYATYMAQRLDLADPGAAAGLRFGVVSAISTDLGNTGIFPPLISGGCVQLIGAEASMDAEALLDELQGGPLDVLKITPSHLRALLGGHSAAKVIPRRCLVLGGEALTWDLVQTIRTLAPSCRILNHYGPTEATIGCCTYDVDAERRPEAATVPIGAPIAATNAYILDRGDQLLPAGVAGELCIAGAGVAAGYVGDSGDSESRFGPDPFAGDRFARMYRTGDRVRRLRDGAIEFLGRVDDQVKIRGFRIEPGEIEAALISHPAIRQAAVTAEPDERGTLRLVGYLVSSEDPAVEPLQAFLSETLPDYMIPATFATLDALPLTPSGKLDRRALPEIGAIGARREAQFVAPRDPVEEEIAGIWRELLGVERVGVFDDFFALGGHSLLATQAIMRIRRAHGDIPLRALLAAPTVAALAGVVRNTDSDAAPGAAGS